MASLFKRGKVWWVCYRENNRQFNKSLKTQDKVVAKYYVNEIENKIAKAQDPFPDDTLTAAEAFKEFKQSRQGRIVLKTAQTDNYRIDLFIKEKNIYKLSDINESRLKAHLDERIEAGLSHRTANHTIRIIKTFLNWAYKSNKLTKNPIAHMERFKLDAVEPRFLTEEEIKKMLAQARSSRIYLLLAAAVYTGMRFSELDRLQWEDIDFKNAIISVRLSKPGRFRKVPLHKDLSKILMPHRSTGKCFNNLNFKGEFEKIRTQVKIGHFRFHDLRHTFASLLIKSGVDIYTVSKLLGHSQVTTTQVYSHLYQDHIQEAMGKLRINVVKNVVTK